MTRIPTYEELEQRIRVLEEAVINGKRAEEALRQSKEALQILFEDHAAVKLFIDPDTGAIVTANHAAAAFYGWSRETLAQMNIQQINILPSDKIKAEREDASDQKRPHFEFQHRMADGSVRNVEVFSNRIAMDGHEYLHSIIHDITERKRAEREKTIIAEIGRIISSSLNIDEVYRRFADEACKLIPLDRIDLNVIDRESGIVKIAYMRGIPIKSRNPGASFPLAGSFHEELIRTRTGHILDETSIEELTKRSPYIFNVYKAGIRSLLTVPLISRDEVIGSLGFHTKIPNTYTELELSIAQRIGDQIAGAIANAQLFTELKKVEEILRRTLDQLESRVQERTIELQEMNTALQVLLKKGGADQRKWEEGVQSNIDELVMPFLHKLKNHLSDKASISYLNILETNLNTITSQFINQLSTAYKNLTPKEVQIAELIKQGKSSKDIAELFGLSLATVVTHRNKIRKKMHLTSKKANLRSHLLFLS